MRAYCIDTKSLPGKRLIKKPSECLNSVHDGISVMQCCVIHTNPLLERTILEKKKMLAPDAGV